MVSSGLARMIISLRKREMVAFLCSAVSALVLFLKVWWVDLRSVIVAVPGLLFISSSF